MTITNISKKQLKDALNNILEDLNANDRDFKGDDLNFKKIKLSKDLYIILDQAVQKNWKKPSRKKMVKIIN